MPRYLIERTFPDGLHIAHSDEGRAVTKSVANRNAENGVTWIHSYVTEDKKHSWCIYDGPDPESIRVVAEKNGLPVDKITKVSVLDPYFYTG